MKSCTKKPVFKLKYPNLSMILVIFVTGLNLAQAAETPAAPPPASSPTSNSTNPKKNDPNAKHSLTFEDEVIEGSTAKPELFYLFQKKNFSYGKLIRLRENFLPEMRRSSDDVQRGKNSN